MLGPEAFSGSFARGSIALGLGVHLIVAAIAGAVGTAALLYVLGARAGPVGRRTPAGGFETLELDEDGSADEGADGGRRAARTGDAPDARPRGRAP